MDSQDQIIHPGWLRVMHWLNALAVVVLILSGWRIYNATGFLGFTIPKGITLGGWLGGALQWHFAAMWLLGVNGLLYLLANLISGRLLRKFFPLSPKALLADSLAALKGKLAHADPSHYNMVQRLAYLFQSVQAVRQGYLLRSARSTAFTVSASAKSTARSASSVRRPSPSDLSSRSRRCPG